MDNKLPTGNKIPNISKNKMSSNPNDIQRLNAAKNRGTQHNMMSKTSGNLNNKKQTDEKSKVEQVGEEIGKKAASTGLQAAGVPKPLADFASQHLVGDFKKKIKLYLIGAGLGIGLGGLVLICLLGAIFAVVSSVSEALSPVTDFFSSLGHWFAGDGWCPNETECAAKAESDFYEEVQKLYDEYKYDDDVELDTEVLTAAALYNRFDNFNGISKDTTADPDKDTSAKTDEEKKEAYKEGKDRLAKLAKNLVSGSELDYSGFKYYLVNDYIPKYYEDLYDYYPSNEQKYIKNFHANSIISFSSNLTALGALANTNLLGKYCSAVKINDETGNEIASLKLEDYVGGIIQKIGSSYNVETQKSLAIAVRTYIIDATDYCDVALVKGKTAIDYDTEVTEEIKNTVSEVADLVMYYQDETFEASYDYLNGTCDASTGKCQSSTYIKEPSQDTHSFEVDKSKVTIDNSKITNLSSSKGLSIYGAENLSVNGIKYEEILKTFYANDIEVKRLLAFDSDYVGTEGIYRDMLYPVGWANTRGACQSAGEYYSSGKYHGSQDLACGTMGLWGKCTEIPIISSYAGVVVSVIRNQQCTSQYENSLSTGYTYDEGCDGNGVRIKVTDPNSDAHGYTVTYWHFDAVAEEIVYGAEVYAGQFLGYMGSTGNSSGYHLHFNVKDTTGKDVIMDSEFVSYCKTHVKKGD